MAAFEIPLDPTPQTLSIVLGSTPYNLTVRWCVPAAAWIVDIADSTGTPIVSGIPLVTGADLLEQYAYLGFGGQLIAQTDHDLSAPPTFDNLGSTGHLFFVTKP